MFIGILASGGDAADIANGVWRPLRQGAPKAEGRADTQKADAQARLSSGVRTPAANPDAATMPACPVDVCERRSIQTAGRYYTDSTAQI